MAILPYYETVTDTSTSPPIISITSPTNLPTPSEVRNKWCYGLPLVNQTGVPMSDDDILTQLEAAVRTMERELGIFLKPTVIYCNGESRGLTEGVDFDREEPPYDYDAKQWVNYGFLQLRERPIISIEEFQLVLPNFQVIMDFKRNSDWLKINAKNGQVQLVPYAGDPSLFSVAGGTLTGYPFISGAIAGQIPQMLYVSYTAGYKRGEIPKDVRNAVAKLAAIDVLAIAGDALLAGVTNTSLSMDGVSESVGTTISANSTLYQARINQYQKDVDKFFDPKAGVRASERGITMTGL